MVHSIVSRIKYEILEEVFDTSKTIKERKLENRRYMVTYVSEDWEIFDNNGELATKLQLCPYTVNEKYKEFNDGNSRSGWMTSYSATKGKMVYVLDWDSIDEKTVQMYLQGWLLAGRTKIELFNKLMGESPHEITSKIGDIRTVERRKYIRTKPSKNIVVEPIEPSQSDSIFAEYEKTKNEKMKNNNEN